MDELTQDSFLSLMQVRLGVNYTEEQLNLIEGFGEKPTFCFADPGTGKTYTAIGGLLNTELFKKTAGQNIYALSFTRLATAELAIRHEKACRKLGITKRVNFTTLHALCKSILEENYKLLNMQSFKCSDALSIEDGVRLVNIMLNDWKTTLPLNTVKNIVRACSSLNSSLVFDRDHVESKYAYKLCDVSYELFEKIRGTLLAYSIAVEQVSVSDILLYTLILLTTHPELSAKYKEQIKVMLIDEAQDLSLLDMRIISLLTDNPIFIGDMKQQIYAFNGACQEIVKEFFKLFPNATTYELTQSFRCKNEIAAFATKTILPNNIGGTNFKGTSDGGVVRIYYGYDRDNEDSMKLQKICDDLSKEFRINKNRLVRDYLFLYRNNASATPVFEALYQRELPFRSNNFVPAYSIPIIKQLCELLQLAENPYDYTNIRCLDYLVPEFKQFPDIVKHPLYMMGRKTGNSVFAINYQFKDPSASKGMALLFEVSEMIRDKVPVKELFNHLWPVFKANYIIPNSWRFEFPVDYYINTVSALTHKDFVTFMQDEIKKKKIVDESNLYDRGPRCYTMHASKGLEADVVFILDADTGIVPSEGKLKSMCKKDCYVDAARCLREDRSLVYVACTRAKDELHIVYNDTLSPLFTGDVNEYMELDAYYTAQGDAYDDIKAFVDFAKEYINI